MSSIWINERIDGIYSRVASKVTKNLISDYPDLNFTMDDSENIDPKFPTVYMFFDTSERGQTLDGGVVNAVYMTVRTQVKVTTAQGNEVAQEVNAAVRDELKKMFFTTSGSPIPTTSGDIKVINSSYARLIGYNDPIL